LPLIKVVISFIYPNHYFIVEVLKVVHWLEVECKAKVDDPALLRKRILKVADFKKKESRGDDYFRLPGSGYPSKAFRIRDDGKKLVVNFKKHIKSLWKDGVVVKAEHEFELSDRKHLDNFLALLEDFGFKEWVKKRKTTEKFLHKKDKRIVIELNHVQHVGTYLEIEYLAQKREVEKARKAILQTLWEIGVPRSNIDNVGYTRRLYDKGIMDRKYFLMKKYKDAKKKVKSKAKKAVRKVKKKSVKKKSRGKKK
jgi:predicted adenylyl cyclase CyaB